MSFSNLYTTAYNTFKLDTSSVIKAHYESTNKSEPLLLLSGGEKPKFESIRFQDFVPKPGIKVHLECDQINFPLRNLRLLIDKKQLSSFKDTDQLTEWRCKGVLEDSSEKNTLFDPKIWNYEVIEIANDKGVSLFKETIRPRCVESFFETRCSSHVDSDEQVYYSNKADFPGIDDAINGNIPSVESKYNFFVKNMDATCLSAGVVLFALSLFGSKCFFYSNKDSLNKIAEETADKPNKDVWPRLSTAQKAQYIGLVLAPFVLSTASIIAFGGLQISNALKA
jgi:hypothetical protein